MQKGGEADLGAQMFGISGDREECLGRGSKEEVVEYRLVLQGDGCQTVGERKDDVIVLDGQQLGTACLEPPGFGQGLTLGTVPVTAGVV
jgi:hypothetical protein